MRSSKCLGIAFAALTVGFASPLLDSAQAQIAAFLPNKDAVPISKAMAIDGDWRINTIGKVIRIEGGRAYAVEVGSMRLFCKSSPIW